MKITLIRHGKTSWNEQGKVQGQANPPLNKEGIEQAQRLAEEMSSLINDYDVIYTSEMQRASKTTDIIRGNSEVPLIIDHRLNSRDVGDFSGLTLDQIEFEDSEQYRMWRSGDLSFIPPNGESTEKLIERTTNFFKDLKALHSKESNILIITHRESVAALRMLITGKKIKNPLRDIKNCTLYEFEI